MRIGTDIVLTTDYNHCQKMSGNKSGYTKGRWYSSFRFQAGISHLFAETDEDTHHALRKKVGPGHAPTTLVVSIVLPAIDHLLIHRYESSVLTCGSWVPIGGFHGPTTH